MKKLLVTSFIAATAISFGQAGRPTGDLIAVQRADEQVGGAVRALSYQSVVAGLGSQVKRTLADGRIVVVRPPKGKTWQQHRRTLLDSGMFDSVEPDTFVSPCATVNDPSFPNQWHLHEISVQRAWDFTLGGGRIVAVVDGGVDLTHPDLMANLVPGYNVLTSQTQVSGGVVSDVRTNGHGTRIAGVAAAVGNNGIGVTGVGPDLKIMPVRVTDDAAQGIALRSDLLAGAQWAVQNGATAVNVSYTGVENADVEAMGAWIRTQGAFLVWAAGNANTHWDNFDHPNVTVVGGLDRLGNRWVSGLQGSGYGRGVDVWAPCLQILTTSKGGGYGNAPAGTSFAVPQVAATLALIRDRQPGLSSSVAEKLLLRRAGDKGLTGLDTTWGWGRLNVGKAVENSPRRYRFSLIPLPTGFSRSTPMSINDHGDVVGIAVSSANGYQLPFIYTSNGDFNLIPLPPGYVSGYPTRINNSGLVSLVISTAGNGAFPKAAVADANMLVSVYPSFGYDSAQGNDISESGLMVGAVGSWSVDYVASPDSAFWTSPSNVAHAVPSGVWFPSYEFDRLYSVNSAGLATGGYARSGFNGTGYAFLVDLNTQQVVPIPGNWAYRGDAYRIRDSGWIGGSSRETNGMEAAQRVRIAPGPLALTQIEVHTSPYSTARDINNDGDGVGVESGQASIFWGLSSGSLVSLLTSPLPNTVSTLSAATGICNSGNIVGDAVMVAAGSPTRAFLATVDDSVSAAVSLGQLGESPTYIGSIPPALSVTFVDEAGVPYPNSTVQLSYSGSTGRLLLDTPSSVTGPFRMFMRCSAAAIPGYEGPTFLSKMYPPLGEPAAPIDTGFLPFDGPLVGGSPTILMYAGDVDDSGEIDAADIDIVIANFGLVNGDDDWNYAVDVDGTGEIDAADIDLVIANFGLTGDPEP